MKLPMQVFKRHPIWLIISLAAILRLALVVFAPSLFVDGITDNYLVIAQNLLDGNGFSYTAGEAKPTVARAPFYPSYLAVLLTLIGRNFTGLRVVEAMVDVGTVYLVYVLVRRNAKNPVVPSRRWGLAAALVYALQPFTIYYTVKLGSECWFTFWLVLTFMSFFEFLRNEPTPWRAVSWGASLGILILNKSAALLLPGLFLALLVQQRGLAMKYLRAAALAAGITLLLITPWSLRNYVVSGSLVPVQTLTWWNFWYDFDVRVGETSQETVERLYQPDMGGHPYSLAASMDVLQEAHLRREATSWIVHNPLGFIEKVLRNIGEFWYLVESWPKALMVIVYWAVSAPFAVWGLVDGFRSRSSRSLVIGSLSTILYFNLIYAPVFAVFRYSLVVVPFVSILIAIGLTQMLSQVRQRRNLAASRPQDCRLERTNPGVSDPLKGGEMQ